MAKTATVKKELEAFMKGIEQRNPHETEFHQAVREVATSVMPFVLDHTVYRDAAILQRMSEPDRVIVFRVVWEDDEGGVQVNRAWRVQFNNAIGPYKGGLRFDPTVSQSVLKFLGFEQTFKNSLTGLPMGGGKGGSNFDPKGKSDHEVMRFCHAMMVGLHRYIGEDVDVPAGDVGVGGREIGYLFGAYMRLENRFTGTLTGKGLSFGGSAVRKEATGYGCVYFCEEMLKQRGESLEGKRVLVSGSGNVALYAAEKAIQKGAKVLTLSDSDGFIHVRDGIGPELMAEAIALKETRRGRIRELAEGRDGVKFTARPHPWSVPADIAMPCAIQNELDLDAAKKLVDNGLMAVCEGANMPTTAEAVDHFRDHGVLMAPGKAANAGGVAVSGLEQSQNAMRISWPRAEVDRRLQDIMKDIHEKCVEHGLRKNGYVDYVDGANIAGFKKVADAMLSYGIV